MNAENFQNKMSELLPLVDLEAIKTIQSYATELDRDGIHPEATFYKEMYIEFCLVKKHYGYKIAQ